MAKKIALGKGIASLIQETPNEILRTTLETERKKLASEKQNEGPLLVEISEIHPNPNQPRKIFKEKELEELSQSIKENGVIQPLIVAKADSGFELVAGERRLKASKLAGLAKVPVVIKEGTEREKMVMAIIENVQRADLNCVEEALAYYTLMNDYNLTQEEVAKKLGKERSSIANYLRVLKLPRTIIEMVQKELLSFGHAKILASAKEREEAIRFANLAVDQGLSVRELEKLIKSRRNPKISKELDREGLDKLDSLRQKLEQRTGWHFGISQKKNGAGQITLKFSNEAEFNDIYEYLLTK
ncbi:MAG: ParB/RepB/Spo0J family partition protein [Halobacteriovoraceae bacterium]|jgi:ParB family transcriptional regulator, chromosome partitioning protein|nr:ParB/RepB/Spo0J family partition protein [Halobacteriovoraceae bacterium]MBT5096116.1 ParB/RepB/Spo0J family partition protein [Halobacteriovoraceae bacterium]